MTECLLTNEEIRIILEILEYNPAFRHPDVISFGNERTSIVKVTPINGLIIIKGDSHTGFTHINERHNYWSDNYYWKEESNSIKLDDPSKFSRKSIPIMDYANVAETLFSEANRNIEKNKRPEIFAMFSGEVEDVNNGKMKYHMLLYKDTKIVHTIFPHKKKHNKEKHINYRRGKPSGKLWLIQKSNS